MVTLFQQRHNHTFCWLLVATHEPTEPFGVVCVWHQGLNQSLSHLLFFTGQTRVINITLLILMKSFTVIYLLRTRT